MSCRDVTNQTEFDAAANDPAVTCIHVTDSSSVVARDSSSVVAWDSSRVEAWDSSSVVAWGSSRVVARGSSSVVAWGSSRVEAWDSSSVVAWGSSRVEAWDSSRVEAWDSSSVVARDSSSVEAWDSSRVVARDSSSVVARGSSRVEASKYVAIHRHGDRVTVAEGTTATIIDVPDCIDLDDWADYHGSRRLDDGRIVAFKALGGRLESANPLPDGTECIYAPGTTVEAPDWDGGPHCGGGLHVSPSPIHGERYRGDASRYVAVAVDPAEAVAVAGFGGPADKLKARTVEVLYEVDRRGDRIEAGVPA